MRVLRLAFVIAALTFVLIGCGRTSPSSDEAADPLYATTIYPFRSILEPVVGERASVRNLLPAGASPHTYDPKPSDARTATAARLLFYGAPELDQWATRLGSGPMIALIDLLPESLVVDLPRHADAELRTHDHAGGRDPHFWMDPLTVAGLLPALVDTLCGVDLQGCSGYRANAAAFSARLESVHDSVETILGPLEGHSVLLSHPFIGYLLHRHGIRVAGIVEELPGSEPTARDMQRIVNEVRKTGADAILVLPQLPDRAARAVSETLNIPSVELDPMGGTEGRMTYEDLILYNAHTLRDALIGAHSSSVGRAR